MPKDFQTLLALSPGVIILIGLAGVCVFMAYGFVIVQLTRSVGVWFRERRRARQSRVASEPFWPALTDGTLSDFDRTLYWSGFFVHRRLLFKGVIVGIVVIFGLLVTGHFFSIFLVAIIIFGAYVFIKQRAGKTERLFLRQLPDGLAGLVDTLRAGYSLPQAISFIAREVPAPLNFAFQALERSGELTMDFSEALQRVQKQLGVAEWTIVSETLIAVQRLGGNIIPLLEEQAKAVRDRISVEEEIRTMTAAGKMSGLIIAGLLPIVVVFFLLVSPSYINILFQTVAGRLFFTVAIMLELVGFLWIRRITQVDF
ncbi:MAG: hypothetical protein EXS55_04425 [Candidatus Magasanikbacteria bacterium]|nr:hypothetical protein [Candidatus Magasanikbacteria bacterium]